MTTASTTEPRYITTVEARKRLGLTTDQWYTLVSRQAVSLRKLPGLRAKVLESDVERLLRESERPAKSIA